MQIAINYHHHHREPNTKVGNEQCIEIDDMYGKAQRKQKMGVMVHNERPNNSPYLVSRTNEIFEYTDIEKSRRIK